MLKLLTCPRGHFWEWEDTTSSETPACPQCGAAADSLPVLDLAPSMLEERVSIPVVELDLFDDEGRPHVVGYEISEDLGRSPLGVRLYRARQVTVNREVLLSVVVAREDASQTAWGSLRGEASALGKLAHPNIVPLYEVGERDRQVFYNVTELVAGPTLAQKVADKPLPFPQVMRLVELLARAVDHAHQKNVLHRNLRPTSVLLQPVEPPRDTTVRDDPSGSTCPLHGGFFLPRLTGFGIVRRAVEGEAIDLDILGEDAGYLSPEQAWGRSKDLGPATDVYGLGGILYFLLTGRPPFRGPTPTEIIDAIQTAELVSPSAGRWVPADLEAICKKCLARSPRRRYASAAALADDLRRAQMGLTLKGVPTSTATQVWRAIWRRPAALILSLLLLASVIIGLVAFAVASEETNREAVNSYRYRNELNSTYAQLAQARQRANRSQLTQAFLAQKQTLDRAARAVARNEPAKAQRLLEAVPENLRAFEWYYLMEQARGRGMITLEANADLTAMAMSPSGRWLATAQRRPPGGIGVRSGIVRQWRIATKAEERKWDRFPGPVYDLAFHPDSTRLAVVGGDVNDSTGELYLFRADEGPDGGQQLFLQRVGDTRLTGVAFSDDGNTVFAAQATGLVTPLTTATGQPQGDQLGSHVWRGEALPVTRLSAGSRDGGLVIFTLGQRSADVHRTFSRGGVTVSTQGTLLSAAIGAGPRVALGSSNDNRISIHELDNAEGEVHLGDLSQPPTRLAFSPDGTRLAASFPDDTVTIWATAGGVWVEVLTLENAGAQTGLAFGNGGKTLATGGKRSVSVWGVVE